MDISNTTFYGLFALVGCFLQTWLFLVGAVIELYLLKNSAVAIEKSTLKNKLGEFLYGIFEWYLLFFERNERRRSLTYWNGHSYIHAISMMLFSLTLCVLGTFILIDNFSQASDISQKIMSILQCFIAVYITSRTTIFIGQIRSVFNK